MVSRTTGPLKRAIPRIDSRIQSKKKKTLDIPFKQWRAPAYFLLLLVTTAIATNMMLNIISTNKLTLLEPFILILFSINFFWLTSAFWSSIIGFILTLSHRDPISLKKMHHFYDPSLRSAQTQEPIYKTTAIIMPIYNEDPFRVMGGIEASLKSLLETGATPSFDFFILSDSTDDDIAAQEKIVWQRLCQRFSQADINIFYRRRTRNHYRKVGNIVDFCERWGSQYEYMIVFDADSIMDGNTMAKMVHHMQTHPTVGLLQTVPRPVRQHTFLGRFLQFAAELNSPILARGNSFWQTDNGNYWGHNAIIRIDAFMQSCGLPCLAGDPPFGGEIMSHDFVEAALLRRDGWDVITLSESVGSYEETPSNIIDYIVRDRRWAQGNIQHLRLLNIQGLSWISRYHFLNGAMAYIASLLWLIMLSLGTIDAVIQTFNSNQFFTQSYQLFPNWHIAKPELIYSLLGLTLLMLFTPKILSLISAIISRRHDFGGTLSLLFSTLVEVVVAILIAPVMMIFHSYFVFSTLAGINVGWKTQQRDGRIVPWKEAAKHTLLVSLTAMIWGSLSYIYADNYFWWLLPVLVGLVLAAPIIRYSSSLWLGRLIRRFGIFVVPSEVQAIDVLTTVDEVINNDHQMDSFAESTDRVKNTPNESWKKMPIQHF